MRLRQIALVAADLEPTIEQLGTELGAEVCFRDPGVATFGLHNALLALGDTFLEVVSPVKDDTTAGRYLERRGGDGGYMVILQLDPEERADALRRADELGVRQVFVAEHTIDGQHAIGTHFHPADTGGAILSVDTATPPQSWIWAGTGWASVVRRERAGAITGATIQADDPSAMAARWGALLGIDPADDERLMLERSSIRFVPVADGRGEGLAAIEVEALDPALRGRSCELAGIRIDWG